MNNPKTIVGLVARGVYWNGQNTACELLEANGRHVRARVTFPSGEVREEEGEADDSRVLEHCTCTVLSQAYGDDFTHFAHNYIFVEGVAYEIFSRA